MSPESGGVLQLDTAVGAPDTIWLLGSGTSDLGLLGTDPLVEMCHNGGNSNIVDQGPYHRWALR